MGFLETRKPKSVTAGIQWRGEWDVIRDRGNKRELKVKIVEDTVVYGSEVLKFKLNMLSGVIPAPHLTSSQASTWVKTPQVGHVPLTI